MIVPGVSPTQIALTPASASAPGGGTQGGFAAFNHDTYLDDFLAGSPPQVPGARASTAGQGSRKAGSSTGLFICADPLRS